MLLALLVATSTASTSTATSIVTMEEPAVERPEALFGLRRSAWPSLWSRGDPRAFVATTVDFGFLYLRPRFSFGYGLPHHAWVGADLNPILSSEGAGSYAGIRIAFPEVNLRVGGRFRYTFRRKFLSPQDNYTRDDIELRDGPVSKYLSLETELTTGLALGPGSFITELAATAVLGVDDGYYVYEETIRVVLDPPWAFRGRFGYAFNFGPNKAIKLGAVFEMVYGVGRDETVLRGGIIARVRLFEELEARGTFIPVIAAEDRLGTAGSDTFLIGIRHRWATGLDGL